MGFAMNMPNTFFVSATLSLPDTAVVRDGVIPAGERLGLLEMRDAIERLMAQARSEADAIVAQARREADGLLGRARQECEAADQDCRVRAESLLSQINGEWRRVVESLEPTAVAVARLAIERVCAGATLADRVDAAARAAIRELPERPVRLRVAPGSRDAVASALSDAMEVMEDPLLAAGSVCVEGEQGSCDASFDRAQATVTNFLGDWATRASSLIQNNQAPQAPAA